MEENVVTFSFIIHIFPKLFADVVKMVGSLVI